MVTGISSAVRHWERQRGPNRFINYDLISEEETMTVIELSGVHKRVGDIVALDGINLTVEKGDLVAVLGPNGSGKTTLFELILGLTQPTSGRVITNGRSPGERNTTLRTGAMLQDAGLPENVTVEELVQLVAAAYPRSLGCEEALRRVGLNSLSRRKVTVLSGGERQRLLLAMAIVGLPRLLLLDEPTAAMDAEARRSFWDEAKGAVEDGTTLVFATHDLREADAVARRVVVLRDGRIVADTSPDEMKQLFASKIVSFRTPADALDLEGMPGGGHVEINNGRTRVHSSAPERLVAALVKARVQMDDLLVTETGLEETFLSLVAPRGAS